MRFQFWKKEEKQPETSIRPLYLYEKQVTSGAQWLDKIKPNWYKSISLDEINLNDYGKCALGCTFGNRISTLLQQDYNFAESHGFMTGKDGQTEEGKAAYKILTGAWVREILQRRAAAREMRTALRLARTTEVKPEVKEEKPQ